ncbi:uncharacterized protein LOC143370416 [Andrena cerasifolii]|uniref:uncharacterized protein LOC143370416 n=1 Tax=Andrena cerasifolii TaxID=2819439 RepID=UPI00403845AE
MIVESIFSCSCLLLTCGSCLHTLIKHSYDQYHKFLPHFMYTCNGIAMIGVRSLLALVYKLFIKEYSFDPEMIELEEDKNKGKFNVFDEFLDILGMASLIYSLCYHHGYYLLGACIVTSLSVLDIIKLRNFTRMQSQEIETSPLENSSRRSKTNTPRRAIFAWVFVNGYFAYSVRNYYALVANYPYLLTSCALTPEGFYQGWTIRRTINDYMMAAYVIYMTEALRQTSIS